MYFSVLKGIVIDRLPYISNVNITRNLLQNVCQITRKVITKFFSFTFLLIPIIFVIYNNSTTKKPLQMAFSTS